MGRLAPSFVLTLIVTAMVLFVSSAEPVRAQAGPDDTLKVNVTQARPGVAATNGATSTPVAGAQISAEGSGRSVTATTDAEGGAYFALGPGSYTLTVVSLPEGVEVAENCLDTTSFSVGAADEQWQWDVQTWAPAERLTELPGGALWAFQGCGNQVPPVQRMFRAPVAATATSGGTGASANDDDDEREGGAGGGTTSGGSSAGETPSEEAGAGGSGGGFPLVPVLGGGLLLLGAGGFFVWSRQRTASEPPLYETLEPEPPGPMVTHPQPAPTAEERRNHDLDLRKAVVITPEDAQLKREVDAALGTTGKTRWLSANESNGRIVLGVDVSVDGELQFPRGFRPIGPQTPTILRIFVWPATETSGPHVDIQAWDTRTNRALAAKSSDGGAATVEEAAANAAAKVAPDGTWPVHEWWSEDHPPEVDAAALWPPYKPTPEEVGASIFDPEVDELPADVLDPGQTEATALPAGDTRLTDSIIATTAVAMAGGGGALGAKLIAADAVANALIQSDCEPKGVTPWDTPLPCTGYIYDVGCIDWSAIPECEVGSGCAAIVAPTHSEAPTERSSRQAPEHTPGDDIGRIIAVFLEAAEAARAAGRAEEHGGDVSDEFAQPDAPQQHALDSLDSIVVII